MVPDSHHQRTRRTSSAKAGDNGFGVERQLVYVARIKHHSDGYPLAQGYGEENDGTTLTGENKPRILLMGLRRSGKSSIQRVVFHKMSPHETLFLEGTNSLDIKYIANNSFVQFQIWDFPDDLVYGGQLVNEEMIFGNCGSVVFVIDAQDEPYAEALARLHDTVIRAHRYNPDIFFEVFIHKVDGDLFLSDDHKIDCQREIQQQITDEINDGELDIHMSFYLTSWINHSCHEISIYDHSIFEAFSKVVQKLIPQLPTLENLLNILITSCNMEKSFLFDVVSKVYIATDSNPVDMQSYELCSDMIDVVIDVSCIYGMKDDGDGDGLAYDSESSSVIKLNNGMVLYLREVNNYLALVCLLRGENFMKQGIIDYNIDCFKSAIGEVFKTPEKGRIAN
ncbi:TPA: hypothetical protein N0F65_007414 [Lagenidium giganteum]|uniref:Ras-related GTP-binding protein C n=1 Tax=Lagenidium giganteum TaxID=4803 RepID=A0AAV2ZKS2_9STRA|nr:TPA: hypothetical protein N0F65_007414 [Lagenidium giganteum]